MECHSRACFDRLSTGAGIHAPAEKVPSHRNPLLSSQHNGRRRHVHPCTPPHTRPPVAKGWRGARVRGCGIHPYPRSSPERESAVFRRYGPYQGMLLFVPAQKVTKKAAAQMPRRLGMCRWSSLCMQPADGPPARPRLHPTRSASCLALLVDVYIIFFHSCSFYSCPFVLIRGFNLSLYIFLFRVLRVSA